MASRSSGMHINERLNKFHQDLMQLRNQWHWQMCWGHSCTPMRNAWRAHIGLGKLQCESGVKQCESSMQSQAGRRLHTHNKALGGQGRGPRVFNQAVICK